MNMFFQCNMVETMDDSLIFATLYRATLAVEQFQATYGWTTNWSKSVMYIHNNIGHFPPQIHVPTVDASDLSSTTTVPVASVPVSFGPIEFLRVLINEPHAQFLHIQDLISNFETSLLHSNSIHRPPTTHNGTFNFQDQTLIILPAHCNQGCTDSRLQDCKH